jgi:hypothetical protein
MHSDAATIGDIRWLVTGSKTRVGAATEGTVFEGAEGTPLSILSALRHVARSRSRFEKLPV